MGLYGNLAAYLNMVNISSSHDLYSRKVVQSHDNVLDRPKTKEEDFMHLSPGESTEIVPYGTMPYSVPWWIPSKWKRRRLARTCHTQSSPTGVSFVLGFFKSHFLNQDSFPQQLWWVLTDRDEMVNRRPRIFTPFKRGGKSAQNQRILVRYVIYGCIVGLPLTKPLTLISVLKTCWARIIVKAERNW